MEFLIIVCSATLQDEISMLFERLEITGFTHLPQATGAGKGGGIRLNDEVWPGENSMYMIAVDRQQATAVKDWVRRYRQESLREGLKLFSLPLNEII
ncbi:MAG: hypothetical protein CVV42_05595 [Candidatus Riflebacteria bacterium HGW-Riflebacteria-2]|jgi:hypothetical protein|nr:MAG: hypothetical protein CVV42_05595 [Candidatus Riflebacteria bacterium HGW-Riflebacteria-2]